MDRFCLTVIFYLAFLNVAQAQTCPGFGSPIKNVIYFVNGVDNSSAQMRESRNQLRSALGKTNINRYDIAENRSDGVGRDFYQALKNRQASIDPREFWREARTLDPSKSSRAIREEYADAIYSASVVEYARSEDLRNMVDDFLEDLNAGKKVVLVAHSQGNFFANAAYRFIVQNWPQYEDSIGIVAVASPAPTVEGNGFLTQNAQDKIIFDAVNLKFPVLSSNVNFSGNDAYPVHHGFLTTYMLASNARSRIVNHVNAMVSRLKTPVSPCDDHVAMINTLTASDVRPKSATLRGELTQGTNADVWFSISDGTGSVCDASGQANASKFTAPIMITLPVQGLEPNSVYNYRACAEGSNGETDTGNLVQLITPRNTGLVNRPSAGTVSLDRFEVSTTVTSGADIDVWFVHARSNTNVGCNGSSFDGVGNFSEGDVVTTEIRELDPDTEYKVVACAKGSDLTTNTSPVAIIRTTEVPVRSCGTQAFRGSTLGLSVVYNLGLNKGFSKVTFKTFSIPDGLRVFKHGTNHLLLSTNGLVSGTYSKSFGVDDSFDKVDVLVSGNLNTNTLWELVLECPTRFN